MSKKKSQYKICTIFIDIEDSTGIANYYSIKDHKKFLRSFHNVIKNVLKDDKWIAIRNANYHSFIGDEFKAMINKEGSNKIVSLGLELAVRLKYEWYFTEANVVRILTSDKEPIELNVGMNVGSVFGMPYPVLDKNISNEKILLEGFPITVAKRVQDVCKESQASRIILADRAYREYVRESQAIYGFHYIGSKLLKNLSQSISCYEYLGDELFSYISFRKDNEREKILKTLYEKFPLNPWYASLLAHYYYRLAEDEWYKSPFDKLTVEAKKWYRKTYDVCLKAIQTIKWSKLRSLSTLLLTCLDVEERWEELCYRAEQMFTTDPTFAYALAMKSKGLLGQYIESNGSEDSFLEDSHKEAKRTIALFHGSKDYEDLFISFLMSFYYYSINDKISNTLKSFKKATKYVELGEIKWAYDEVLELLVTLKKIKPTKFNYLEGNKSYEKLLEKIKIVSEGNGN